MFKTVVARILFIFFLLLLSSQSQAEQYLVYFKDKGSTEIKDASKYLSPQSVQRRLRQGIPFSASDLPIHPAYLSQIIKQAGITIIQQSKWLNMVLVQANHEQLSLLKQFTFIEKITPAPQAPALFCSAHQTLASSNPPVTTTDNQLAMLGLDDLHANNLTGKGITITFLDGGFTAIDEVNAYRHVFANNRIIATRNFVEPNRNVFRMGGEGEHGCRVFSITAGFQPNQFYGSAYEASFILAATEDAFNESAAEELNWAAAAEWADSIGTDIINSSLGYFTGFTIGTGYTYQDMDGKTTIVTKAAQMAASKGILVVASVGNEGNKAWQYLIAPSDGDSVLAVGGVDEWGIIGNFSSRGPSADGRIKPDISARADNTIQISSNGQIIWGLGTSFSAPLISGLAACLWQADTTLTNMRLFQLLKESSSRFQTPDNFYGYGIPNGAKAYQLITGKPLKQALVSPGAFKILPHPALKRGTKLVFDNNTGSSVKLSIKIYGSQGQLIRQINMDSAPTRYAEAELDLQSIPLGQEMYYIHVFRSETGELLHKQKLLISETF